MTGDLEALQRKAAVLEAEAEAAVTHFDRTTWIRFFFVFFPVPFAILLFRLKLEPWHYYLAGGAGIVFAALLGAADRAAMAKRDRVVDAAARARAACEEASGTSA